VLVLVLLPMLGHRPLSRHRLFSKPPFLAPPPRQSLCRAGDHLPLLVLLQLHSRDFVRRWIIRRRRPVFPKVLTRRSRHDRRASVPQRTIARWIDFGKPSTPGS